MQDQLTQSRLKELLDYDPETGVFTRRTMRGGYPAGTRAGTRHNAGYWQIVVDRKFHLGHRLAFLWMTGAWPEHEVDHINGDRSDDRWVNLREQTHQQNIHNMGALPRHNTSGFLGVDWVKKVGAWRANITVNRKLKFLGHFPTPELAHAAYLKAKDELHPTHMRLRKHGR